MCKLGEELNAENGDLKYKYSTLFSLQVFVKYAIANVSKG